MITQAIREIAEHLRPARPRDVGVREEVPDMAHIAAARVLANEAHDVLGPVGFTDEQLRLWAESYLAEQHSGDMETFVRWMDAREIRGKTF